MKLSSSRRLQKIVDFLEENNYVKAKEMSERFEVSMETIRKDLIYLEEKGIVKKEYGGASLALTGIEKNMEFRKYHEDDKSEIARLAAQMLREYHSMILDSGSTCLTCVKYINLLPSMDIVTNSVDAFRQLNGNQHNVFLTPGKKRKESCIDGELDRKIFKICSRGCMLAGNFRAAFRFWTNFSFVSGIKCETDHDRTKRSGLCAGRQQ